MSRKINMLFINRGGIRGGGTENRVRTLIEKLISKRFLSKAFVLFCDNKQENKSDNKNIKLIKFNNADIKQKVSDVIKKEKIGLIQIHNLPGINLSFIKDINNEGIPVIYFSHDLWPLCGMNHFIVPRKADIHKICYKAAAIKCIRCIGLRTYIRLKRNQKYLNMCDGGIAPTDFLASIFENHNILKNKWEVVRPWIDDFYFSKPRKLPERTTDILFVGPLLEYKGFWLLLDALKEVAKEIPHIKSRVVGYDQEENNPLYIKYKKKVKKYNLEKNIVFAGRMDKQQLRDEYYNSKILVFPTQSMESFGQVWAEAASLGAQVIASNMPSLRDYYPYFNFFRAGDHIDLARKIIQVLKNDDFDGGESKIFSQKKASDFIKNNFNVNSSSGDIIKIYGSLLVPHK